MKNLKKILIYFLFIGILTSSFTFSSGVPQEMKDWLLKHPEFVDGNFYYVDKGTNQAYIEANWYYYDIKDKKPKAMPGDLKTALIGELITAYDKIDKCSSLDKYRSIIDQRKKRRQWGLVNCALRVIWLNLNSRKQV